jgi:cysteine desulfurase/selenocysteine lyase
MNMNKIDWNKYRELYPIVKERVFLEHASLSPLSKTVIADIHELLEDYSMYGSPKWEKWFDKVDEARRFAARLINCTEDEISFAVNTSDAIMYVVEGLDWKQGDNIVSVEQEFPANYYPWTSLRADGVELKLVPQEGGRFRIEDIEKAINNRTRLVTISWVQFLSGFRAPLKEIGELCRRKNVLFAIDAIQALGALKLDVKECGIDFMFCGGSKWLLSPIGTGIFYCRKDLIERLRLRRLGWMSVKEPFDFRNLSQPLKDSARRFEYSNLNQAGLIGLCRALQTFLEIGPENIEERILYLTDLIADGMAAKDMPIYSPRNDGEKSGIISFTVGEKTQELHNKLMKKDIIVSLREGMIRVAPHYYNNESDIEAFLRHLN